MEVGKDRENFEGIQFDNIDPDDIEDVEFDIAEEDNLIRDFQEETNTFIDPEKQIKNEERGKEWDLAR